MNTYFRILLGEPKNRVLHLHQSTLNRLKTFAIAIHIPIALWATTGYVIAARIFEFEQKPALLVSGFCACLVYLIERLVLSSPKNAGVTAMRGLLGLVMAIIGASMVDLVIFEREVVLSLQRDAELELRADIDARLDAKEATIRALRADSDTARQAANCEANGTCGSGVRSVGPIYRELLAQADSLRDEYRQAENEFAQMEREGTAAIERLREQGVDTSKAGLLSRIEALHRYTLENRTALAAWAVFFLLILLLELMVVFVKMSSCETVDDLINQVRETVAAHKALAYKQAVTSPLAGAEELLSSQGY
jgi:hypothetical protein